MGITTVDNFISLNQVRNEQTKGFSFGDVKKKYFFDSTSKVKNNINITFGLYKETKNMIFSLFDTNQKKDDEVILSVSSIGENYVVNTGNYIGKFTWDDGSKNGLVIDIKSRFSDLFLQRMLNVANNIFLDDVSLFDAEDKKRKNLDYSKFIIYYMFIQKLEKAFLLGLPKSYTSVNHHEMKLKGKIDIKNFIKYDIPFKGKISSTSRERVEIQEIIDILHKAISIIDGETNKNNGISTKNILHIKTHLRENKSNRHVTYETINKALKSKALQNPIFVPYRKVLEYAKFIIESANLEEKKNGDEKTFGFLVNVAELFEIYLLKVIQSNFPNWQVIHEEELTAYKEPLFYYRHMYPDIVMKKDKDIMIFDAKYKRMLMRGNRENIWDVDRNDFFQINTYMTYYKNNDYNVKVGGLLYPFEIEFDGKMSHSRTWLGNNTKFIIDGIDLSAINDKSEMKDIVKVEKKFIQRIEQLQGDI